MKSNVISKKYNDKHLFVTTICIVGFYLAAVIVWTIACVLNLINIYSTILAALLLVAGFIFSFNVLRLVILKDKKLKKRYNLITILFCIFIYLYLIFLLIRNIFKI